MSENKPNFSTNIDDYKSIEKLIIDGHEVHTVIFFNKNINRYYAIACEVGIIVSKESLSDVKNLIRDSILSWFSASKDINNEIIFSDYVKERYAPYKKIYDELYKKCVDESSEKTFEKISRYGIDSKNEIHDLFDFLIA